MSKRIRIIFLVLCAGLLYYGLRQEKHQVKSLADNQAKPLTGPQFVEGATVDNFMRRNGSLYDIYSLSPLEASEKDCKT